MKVNELMIGDWVEPHQCRTHTVYCKVEGIYSDGTVHLDKAERLFALGELHPIPLTSEILEQNGWRRSRTRWLFFRDGCDELNILLGKNSTQVEYLNMIYNPEDNAEVNYSHGFEFPRTIYVHELQHVLRLCGINHEIIL